MICVYTRENVRTYLCVNIWPVKLRQEWTLCGSGHWRTWGSQGSSNCIKLHQIASNYQFNPKPSFLYFYQCCWRPPIKTDGGSPYCGWPFSSSRTFPFHSIPFPFPATHICVHMATHSVCENILDRQIYMCAPVSAYEHRNACNMTKYSMAESKTCAHVHGHWFLTLKKIAFEQRFPICSRWSTVFGQNFVISIMAAYHRFVSLLSGRLGHVPRFKMCMILMMISR